jgi:hypothetical protein
LGDDPVRILAGVKKGRDQPEFRKFSIIEQVGAGSEGIDPPALDALVDQQGVDFESGYYPVVFSYDTIRLSLRKSAVIIVDRLEILWDNPRGD